MSRIIIKNLPSTITEKKLRDIFEEKGHITDLQLKYNKAGVFRKFAFIGFKTEQEAEEAKLYFNNSYIFTSRVQIEICSNLNDPNKPKAWKEFLKEKSEKTKLNEMIKELPTKDKKKKSSKTENDSIPDELKKDPKFKEFLAVHEDRKSKPLWADDIGNDTEDVNESHSSNDDDDDGGGFDSAPRDETEEEEKNSESVKKLKNKAKQKSSSQIVDKADQKVPDKKIKIYDDQYTVKLRNLPYSCKKKQIKKLFHPLKIISLRLPRKSKGFAYVSFKTEKDMNIALNKHRGFLGDHRIDVIKYTKKETFDNKKLQEAESNDKVDLDLLAETGRIYVRNLCFSVTQAELEELFSKYGPLAEIYLPVDRYTKQSPGFAFVTYLFAEHAVSAFSELDGSIFQGRLLHLIPAQPKKEFKTDENVTNYKKLKEAKIKSLSGSSHNWNILFMGMNAVADVISEKYKVEKSKLLSGDSKDNLAVRMALAETKVVLDTRKFLVENGVQLDALSQAAAERSKTVIIVKNLPAKTTSEELNEIFSKHGTIQRIVLPPSGMIALIEYQDPYEARNAFKKLAYSRFHYLPLYLEWAPIDSLKEPTPKEDNNEPTVEEDESHVEEPPEGTTIFVKNLNFSTSQESLKKHFEKCGPVCHASIPTKKDLKAGKLLSMGFGFVQYKERSSAVKAITDLQLSKLDGHALEIKFAKREIGPVESKKKKNYEVKKQLTAKILVRNIPFEASEREVKDLFKEFGTLKNVRLPQKMGSKNEHKGFGFVEYTTKNDAKRAFDALCHSTHLYGRRLVLEWANPETENIDEIRKKTARDFSADSGPKTKVKKSKLKEDVALASIRSRPEE